MSKVFNFKKDVIDQLPVAGKQYDIADSKTANLRLMVNPGGSKTFFLYKKVKGRPERIKIGRYPDITIENARKEAARLNSLITLGGNPQEDRATARNEPTFKELFDLYYNEHAVRHTKRPEDNKKMLDLHIMPLIGKHKASAVTSEKIRSIHHLIGENSGQPGSNRVMQITSAVFNFGIKHGHFQGKNPCAGLKKFKVASRDRFFKQR